MTRPARVPGFERTSLHARVIRHLRKVRYAQPGQIANHLHMPSAVPVRRVLSELEERGMVKHNASREGGLLWGRVVRVYQLTELGAA